MGANSRTAAALRNVIAARIAKVVTVIVASGWSMSRPLIRPKPVPIPMRLSRFPNSIPTFITARASTSGVTGGSLIRSITSPQTYRNIVVRTSPIIGTKGFVIMVSTLGFSQANMGSMRKTSNALQKWASHVGGHPLSVIASTRDFGLRSLSGVDQGRFHRPQPCPRGQLGGVVQLHRDHARRAPIVTPLPPRGGRGAPRREVYRFGSRQPRRGGQLERSVHRRTLTSGDPSHTVIRSDRTASPQPPRRGRTGIR